MSDQSLAQRVRTVWWEDDASQPLGGRIRLLDQSLLPTQVVHLSLSHEQQVAEAIKTLKVRGAPAIGVTAAYGVALAARRLLVEQTAMQESLPVAQMYVQLENVISMLEKTRPTAVNLFWALRRMQECAGTVLQERVTPAHLADILLSEAQRLADEDARACLLIGTYGASLIADDAVVLTHCNAGALATLGLGTALAPIYVAHRAGKRVRVFVDETRPVLQGARLTAWELQQEGVPFTLITDNMAAHFMRHGNIRAVFVGADRIAANGDVANKIGTYGLAVLAQAHNIPLYVAAPSSTIDQSLASGDLIPIEQRDRSEVTLLSGIQIAPPDVDVENPAFDVTPHTHISAIITEYGIARPPYDVSLRHLPVEHVGL